MFIQYLVSFTHSVSAGDHAGPWGKREQFSSPFCLKDSGHQSDCKGVSGVCVESATKLPNLLIHEPLGKMILCFSFINPTESN